MASDWAGLHEHLLNLVLERLVSPSDYVGFSMVCRSWHCRAKDYNKQCCAKMLGSCHYSPPMLLIPTGKNGIWRLYNVMENKVLDLQLKVRNARLCGSSKGWLIVVEETFEITLINPFGRHKGRKKNENSIIHLPPITLPDYTDTEAWVKKCNYCVFKATISADPILNSKDCIVVVIYEDQCQLAFIRLSQDTTWTYVDQKYTLIEEVVFIQDKCYALDNWNKLLSLDIASQSNSINVRVVSRGMKRQHCNVKRYLVALNAREILMVQRYFRFDDNMKRETTKFKVFKLNMDNCIWIEEETLGDVALFVGDNSSEFALASKFPGCQLDCIYFNYDDDCIFDRKYGFLDFGVYNVKNRTCSQPYTADAMTLVKRAQRPPIWVVPSFQL